MLPKNRIGRRLFTHLFVYSGSEHPHAAQSPKTIEIKTK
jgi:large subunit ribosomal protein L13